MALPVELVDKVKAYIAYRDPNYDSGLPVFDIALEVASTRLSSCVFGSVYYQALGLFILHKNELNKITEENGGGSLSGVIASEKEGELARSMVAPKGSYSSDYMRTGYGVELEQLSKEKVGFRTFATNRMGFC